VLISMVLTSLEPVLRTTVALCRRDVPLKPIWKENWFERSA
jgi:hypothetical protein